MRAPLNEYIDHTLLRPDATEKEIVQLCNEAKEYGFETVCVAPSWVKKCSEELESFRTRVCVVIGFPLGNETTEVKSYAGFNAVRLGADEVDMVMNIGKLKDGDDKYVINEIHEMKSAIGHHQLKVIIETCLLTDEEKQRAVEDIIKGEADYVKTSTGFSKTGATVKDVALLKKAAAGRISIKAAGGIRTLSEMEDMIQAGADRIGTSHGVDIMKDSKKLSESSN